MKPSFIPKGNLHNLTDTTSTGFMERLHSILTKSLLDTLLACFHIPTQATFVTASAILRLYLLFSTRYCTEPIRNPWSLGMARRSLVPGLRRLSSYGLPLWDTAG